MSVKSVPRRVLVVDDDEDVRVLVSRVLTDAGHAVEVAEGGEQALERVRAERPDLVVLDLMMPGVDGWTVLQKLRETPEPPPVVVLTARGDASTFSRTVRSGAAAFVFKPFRFHELLGTCDKVLRYTASTRANLFRERRRDPRRTILVEVSVLAREGAPPIRGELVNVSAAGAQVDLERALEPGEWVRVSFPVPAGGTLLSVQAQVQWRRPAIRGHVHGVFFRDLPPEMEERLRELMGPAPAPRKPPAASAPPAAG